MIESEVTVYEENTQRIVQSFFKVYNTLGPGFLESVYENALAHEIQTRGGIVERQKEIIVRYEGTTVGHFFADLLVDGVIIVEVKATDVLRNEHEWQLLNYLRATEIEIGLLAGFCKKPEIRRKIFTNDRKRLS